MTDINRLLEKPCYIIDFLPRQVPKDCGGQFFKVETYLLNNYERYDLRDNYIRIILKLMCYYRVSAHWGEWIEQPAPEQIAEIIDTIMHNHSGWMDLLFPDKDALLQFEWDCMSLSIYNPDEEMRGLLEQIAWSEGMFFRKAASVNTDAMTDRELRAKLDEGYADIERGNTTDAAKALHSDIV